MKTVTVEVTQAHIDEACERLKRARVYRTQNRPLALAISEAVGETVSVCDTFRLMRDTCRNFPLPPKARDFQRRFDDGREVKPISFQVEFETPDEVQK